MGPKNFFIASTFSAVVTLPLYLAPLPAADVPLLLAETIPASERSTSRTGEATKTAAAPEVSVLSVDVSNSIPKVGEKITVTVRLRNTSANTIKGVKIRFLAGERKVGERSQDVPTGDSKLEVAFTAETPGSLTVSVFLECPTCPRKASVRVLNVAKAEPKIIPEKPKPVAQGQQPKGTGMVEAKGKSPGPQGGVQGEIPHGSGGPKIEGQPSDSPFGRDVGPHGDILGLDKTGKDQSGLDKYSGTRPQDKLTQTPDKWGMMMDSPEWQSKQGNIGPGKYAGGMDKAYKNANQTFERWSRQSNVSRATLKRDGPGYTAAAKFIDGTSASVNFDEFGDTGWEYKGKDGKTTFTSTRDSKGNGWDVKYNSDGSRVETKYVRGKSQTPQYYGAGQKGGVGGSGGDDKSGGSGSQEGLEGTDEKFDPKTMDPKTREKVAKYLPQRHTDPRVGQVGDPMLEVSMTSRAAGGGEKGMAGPAGGGGKIEAKWVFAGMKPGWTLTGGGREGEGKKDKSHIEPVNPPRKFILPDPPESTAISAAQANAHGKGATLEVTGVSGGVEKLTVQGGKQGWAPLQAGDNIVPGTIVRVNKETGGTVQVGSAYEQASQQKWEKIHEDENHTVHVLKGTGTRS